jgi:FKBP-type peptidyl-prolyl cis-trans isomerase (trigger factor)
MHLNRATRVAQQGNVMEFSEIIVAEEIDEILRRATMRMQQQTIHIQELQAGPERSSAQGQLRHARAACDQLRTYRARFGEPRVSST